MNFQHESRFVRWGRLANIELTMTRESDVMVLNIFLVFIRDDQRDTFYYFSIDLSYTFELVFCQHRYESIQPGETTFLVEYKKKIYCFLTEECQERFLR